ncbi:MAG: TadE/TadG family type IV pilus assembly protein [Thermoguttaceae bacterium]
MTRAAITACWPCVVVLVGLVLAAHFLVRLSNGRLRLGRLRRLHGDQAGSVQTLSFVLTLPIFIMVMMLIVQVSQLMIGLIVVHYAAYAAARSAVVWIPANTPAEPSNCISAYEVDPDAPNQVAPALNPQAANFGPTAGGLTYLVQPGSDKYNKIASAAILACMPISPSRDLGFSAGDAAAAGAVLQEVYASVAPASQSNAAVPARLDHKLAYSSNNTKVQIRFFHKNEEPPLITYFLDPNPAEFAPNELGWQDTVTVTVNHDLALLPGPGRLLARWVVGPGGQTITDHGTYYSYPLTASITMGNEGEKSALPYVYQTE